MGIHFELRHSESAEVGKALLKESPIHFKNGSLGFQRTKAFCVYESQLPQ